MNSINKCNHHSKLISLDQFNVKPMILTGSDTKKKKIEVINKKIYKRSPSKTNIFKKKEDNNNIKNKEYHHTKNVSCYVIGGKNKNIVINKIDLFKNIKKNSILFSNKLPPNIKNIKRSNSINNLEQTSKNSTDATLTTITSKRIKENKNGSEIPKEKSGISKKQNNKNKKIATSNNIYKFIPKHNKEPKICFRNLQKKKRKKNFSVNLTNYITQYKNLDKSLSLLLEDSVFSNSKHRSSSNTHNDSSSNKVSSLKYSSNNSNSLDKKSKSISIDFTYSDDEVLSNRKKSEMLIKQTLVKRKENKKNDNNYIKEDFLSFYEEMNKKLFGMGK